MSALNHMSAQPTVHQPLEGTFVLPLCALAGVVGVLKGLSPGITNGVDFYWMLDYRHGFIKRALVGTIFHPVLSYVGQSRLAPVVLGLHTAACLLIIYTMYRLFRRAIRREELADARVTAMLAFLCLMCSPLMPSLAYIVGYLDVYVILIVLAAFSLVLDERYGAAAVVASIGPLIHDASVFLWSPVAIMLLWSCFAARRRTGGKLLAVGLPILSALAVAILDNRDAAVTAIQQLPLQDSIKDPAVFQLQQTLRSAFEHMTTLEYPGHLGNVLTAAAFFLAPTAVILWAAAFVNWRRWGKYRLVPLAISVLATVAPLSILLFAWDLSRFLAWSTMAAALALIGLGSPALLPASDAHAK